MAERDLRHSDRPSEVPGKRRARRTDRRPRNRQGRWLRRSTAALVVLLLALGGVSHQLQLGPRWLGWDYPSPQDEPAEVAPPPGLTLPEQSAAPAVAAAVEDRSADPTEVRRAVSALLRDPKLGGSVAVAVHQLSDGSSVFRTGPDLVTPASTMKLLTTVSVLAALGPEHRFGTTVVTGASPRDIVLVGGGDPLLASGPVDDDTYPPRADIRTLARATAARLDDLGRTTVRLGYDTSLFTGPEVSPDWRASYVPDDVVSPISPLWVDEGRTAPGASDRVPDPAAAAAETFRVALRKQGITVKGTPRPVTAPEGAMRLGAVQSAPLAQIVQWVLEVSDNEGAEVLARHVSLAEGLPASFDGASDAMRRVLADLGIDTTGERLLDGSGLSRRNRLDPETLVAVLEVAASGEHPELRSAVAGLPVAGFTGSLASRFGTGDPAGLGAVRAKTGTLTGVHGLAGVVTDRDGTELAFVAVADRVKVANTLDARATLDEVAAALAGCRCGG